LEKRDSPIPARRIRLLDIGISPGADIPGREWKISGLSSYERERFPPCMPSAAAALIEGELGVGRPHWRLDRKLEEDANWTDIDDLRERYELLTAIKELEDNVGQTSTADLLERLKVLREIDKRSK
jgi:hypothetical protein